jgi:hypothetical protein
MVDLLVLTSSDRLLFLLKLYYFFFTKQPTLLRKSIVPSHPLLLALPGCCLEVTFANASLAIPLP